MIELVISEQGGKETVAYLGAVGRICGDLTPYWPDVLIALREIESDAFRSEGGTTSAGRWKPLSTRYAVWKQKHYPGKPILERTGDLRAAYLGGANSRVAMTPKTLRQSIDIPYASYHQEGTNRLARRPVWSPTERDAFRIADVISKGIRRSFRVLDSKSSFSGRFTQAMS